MERLSVSIVMPCLNEERAVGKCVKRAKVALKRFTIYDLRFKNSEVIVIDNGSTDRSAEVARRAGARVVKEEKRGYGFALRRGISEAKGGIIVMGDCDGSYDFSEIGRLVNKVLEGYDLVVGSRFLGKIKRGAMPFWHRHLGTPILNFLFHRFFGVRLSDTQSGFRAFKRGILKKIIFRTGGMEFASEMLFKASRMGLKIAEVPISYSPRVGASKLSPLRDAWRHIKFMLLFSPSYLFVFPGLFLFSLGFFVLLRLALGPFYVFGKGIDIHSMLVSSFITILGFQIIFLGLFAKTYALLFLREKDIFYSRLLSWFTLEKGIFISAIFSLIGLVVFLTVFYKWAVGGFGALSEVRILILSMTILILGIQGIFSSFFFALLGSREGIGEY